MKRGLLKSLAVMAWRNLRRNLRRNLATGVAISAGFIAFLLAAGYAIRVDRVLTNYTIYALRAGHISILRKGALEMYPIRPQLWSLTEEDQQLIESKLKAINTVEAFGPLLTGQGIIGNGCKTFPFLALGTDPQIDRYALNNSEFLKWAPHIESRRFGKALWEYPSEATVVAVSSGLARLLGKTKVLSQFSGKIALSILNCSDESIKDRFADDPNVQLASGTWDGQLNAIDADIVQTFSTGMVETNNSSVTLPIKHLQSLFNTSNIKSYAIWLGSLSEVKPTIKKLRDKLGPSAENLDILPWNDERIGPYYVGTMRFIVTMVAFIGFVLALVVVLSIFNSATMTVIERSEEIGMLRSLGYTRRLIRIIFALEGLFLTLVSTLVGIVLGISAILLINSLGIHFNPPGVEGGIQLVIAPDYRVMILAKICVSSLGLMATWVAVSGLSRKNISELIAGAHR